MAPMRFRVIPGDAPLQLTISIGVAAMRPGKGLDTLIDAADRTLYEAKAAGRNRVKLAPGA